MTEPVPAQREDPNNPSENGNARPNPENRANIAPAGQGHPINHNVYHQRNGAVQGNVNGVPPQLQVPLIQVIAPERGITVQLLLKYIIGTIAVIGLFAFCLYIQREYYIRQLLKHRPSPSPFTVDDPIMSKAAEAEADDPEADVISIKYQPPSEVLQKIPFLKKSEEEIYADQMKQVMWSLREAVKRMDRGGNETQLAGVITMKPNDKPGDVVNVKADDLEEGVDETGKPSRNNPVTDLVERISSALSKSGVKDLSSEETKLRKQNHPKEDPIQAILDYRKQYFRRDEELAQVFSQPGATRDQKLIDEADQRDAIRRRLIVNLIDHFFRTETDDEARIEKAYHYAMSETQQYERIARLESELFGTENLVKGGPDVVFGQYRKQMGYIYEQSLKTFVNGSELEKVKKLQVRERKGFFSEMRIMLKLEKRIREKVVKAAKILARGEEL